MPLSCCLTDAIEAALGKYPADKTLWLALSGGLDSVSLLHRLATLPQYQPRIKQGQLKAIHIHHGLSEHADEWLSFCQQLCAEFNIPFYAEKITLNNHHNNIEQQARDARYQVFSQYVSDGEYLLTAHHADDQLETFFLRLLRGAGLDGLAGIPRQRQHMHFTIVRPLLGCSRAQLQDYAQQQQLNWVEDESNQDTWFDRNWWRQHLLPQIWQQFPGRKTAILRSLQQLQQDRAILSLLLDEKLDGCRAECDWPQTKSNYLKLTALAEYTGELQPYIIRRWLQQNGISAPSSAQLQQFCVELFSAHVDKHPQLLIGDWVMQRFQQGLYLRQREASLETGKTLVVADIGGNSQSTDLLSWGGASLVAEASESGGIVSGTYRVVSASECRGMTLQPKGRPHKTLKHVWQENHVPLWVRDHWPCMLDEQGELVAVIGLSLSQLYYSDSGWSLHWRTK